MAYNSKYTGQEVDNLLDKINNDNVGEIDSALSSTSENPVMNKVVTERFNGVDAEIANRVPFSTFGPFALETTVSLESHDVLIEDLQDNKADTSGYYPELHVGLSDNLPDRGDIVEGAIGFRASAGEGNSIEDGVANVQELLGDSVVWNQNIQNADFRNGTQGWDGYGALLSVNADGSVRVTNVSGASQGIYQSYEGSIQANKKVLMWINYKRYGDTSSTVRFYLGKAGGGYDSASVQVTQSQEWCAAIISTTDNIISFRLYPYADGEVNSYCDIFNCGAIDLTKMFGAGNEPTTIEEFNAFCNQLVGVDLNAYNEGEVLGVHTKGFKSVNDNAWDEEWENGTFNTTTGENLNTDVANKSIRCKTLIPIIGGEAYYCNEQMWIILYDSEKKVIPSPNVTSTQSGNSFYVVKHNFILPQNAAYMRFYLLAAYGTSYNHDICIRLAHSGYKTDYVAHEESEVSFDLSEYFPYGMHGIGDVRDSATPSKATRRFGRVDLGSLSWRNDSWNGIVAFATSDITDSVSHDYSLLGNSLIAIYSQMPNFAGLSSENDKVYTLNSKAHTPNTLAIRDSAYTDAASFKEAMSGVYLYYELAEPIEMEIDPKQNFSYEVWDFGTEEMLSDVPSMPVTTRTIYGFNATDTIRGNKSKNEEQDARLEDIETTMVQKGDYAPALTVGFADNLVSKDMVVDSEFNLRRSGGGAISDGVARMEVVKGNSVVWNQMYKPREAVIGTQTNKGVTFTVTADGSVTVQGTSEAATSASSYIQLTYNEPLLLSHIYMLVAFGAPAGRWGYMGLYFGGIGNINSSSMIESEGYKIFSPPADGVASLLISCWGGQTIDCKFRPMFFDLTQMFGVGNEPTTIEEFYARCPIGVDMNAYNEGEVIHCNVDAVKSVGRNVWDEEWELGIISPSSGGNISSDSLIRSKNYIPIIPNIKYYSTIPFGQGVFFYNEKKEFIARLYNLAAIPNNAKYMRFVAPSAYGTTYNNDICINLSDPDFNGQYEPYKEDVRELPSATKEVFPNGMMSARTAHDVAYNDLNKEVGVTEKRIGVVNLGDYSWVKGSSEGLFYVLGAPITPGVKTPTNNAISVNALVMGYDTISRSALDSTSIKSFAINSSGSPYIRDTSYTDAASFKAAMQGVMLYYELAEPIVTEHQEPFNLDYQVWNFGTEQAMADTPSAPIIADIVYGFNAYGVIKDNKEKVATMESEIDAIQSKNANQDQRLASIEDILAESYQVYGVQHNYNNSSPSLTRIGNMNLHRTLPVQSKMRRCVVDDNGNVVYYLNRNNSTLREDGQAAVLDGTHGQVMVEIPEHYRACIEDTTNGTYDVLISLVPFTGARKIAKRYVSAFEAVVDRTDSSSLKLSSVRNLTEAFRGGNNNASYDGTYMSFLGMPTTAVSLTDFRTYAKNRGANWHQYDWEAHCAIYWLFAIEYATLNSQASFNVDLDANGYHQGGLGVGVSNMSGGKWSAYNGYYPFVPCGYTLSLGDATGIVPLTFNAEQEVAYGEAYTTNVPSYRGIENPFGHIYKWTDGFLGLGDGVAQDVYVCRDKAHYASTLNDYYQKLGKYPEGTSGYPLSLVRNEYGDLFFPTMGGGSTTYFCDYNCRGVAEGTTYGVFVGGNAYASSHTGLAYLYSLNAPSSTSANIGSRLCLTK